MPPTTPQTADEYIASLPEGRREAIAAVRDVVQRNLAPGFEEGILYGMIGWYVPLERFPETYNGQPLGLAALANQKNYMSLYLTHVYGDRETEDWFRERYAASGKRLNMGKSCVRFTKLEDLPLDVIGEAIARVELEEYLAHYAEAKGSYRKTRGVAAD
ncbi:MAG: iron chaperone [Candidatus Limnocylindria bacterium]